MPDAAPIPANTDVLAAFPSRPLHPKPPISRGWDFGTFCAVVVFGGMLVFSIGWVAPEIITDWQVRNTAVPIRGASLSDGSCTNKLFIDLCDATLTAPAAGQTITRQVHYVFGSFNLGDFTASVVADPKKPEWLATDLGLEYFWNRVVSLVITSTVLAALVVGAILASIRGARTYKSWRTANMVPVPLTLIGQQRAGRRTVWTVQAATGKPGRWTLRAGAKPFILGPANRIAGLMIRGGGSVMPLDAKLRWVELSSAERAAILAAARPTAPA